MIARLGNVLLAVAVIVAVGWLFVNIHFKQEDMTIPLVIAGLLVLAGVGVRYVLTGKR